MNCDLMRSLTNTGILLFGVIRTHVEHDVIKVLALMLGCCCNCVSFV